MGVWFLGTSVGNFIGGRVGGLYESMALPTLFGVVGAFAIVSGLLLAVFVKPMSRLTDGEPRGDVAGPPAVDLRARPPAVRSGVAGSLAARSRARGARPTTCRLSAFLRATLDGVALVAAVHLPMHTATRLALPVIAAIAGAPRRVRSVSTVSMRRSTKTCCGRPASRVVLGPEAEAQLVERGARRSTAGEPLPTRRLSRRCRA